MGQKRTIDWTRQARSDLRKLSKQDSDRVQRAVERLAVSGLGDIERLKGFDPPEYRLRVGDWRVRYRLKNDSMQIVRALHRREAYRKSALVRQDVPSADGFDDQLNWELPDHGSDRP